MGPPVAVAMSVLILCVSRCFSDPVISILTYSAGPLPTVTPDGSVELQSGSSVALSCVGDSTLVWEMPDVSPTILAAQNRFENRQVESRVVKPDCNTLELRNGCYSSNLTLLNVNATDIGLILCRDVNSVSSVFLFVSGSPIACLPVKNRVTAVPGTEVVVPCISTSLSTRSVIMMSSLAGMWYDARRGFVIPRAFSSAPKVLTCRCGSGLVHFQFTVQEYPSEPLISLVGGRSAFLIGETVQLECMSAVSQSNTAALKWLVPPGNEPQTPDYLVQSTTQQSTGGVSGRTTFLSTLVIRSLALRDRGVFKCNASLGALSVVTNFSFTVLETPVVNFIDGSALILDAYVEGQSPKIEVVVMAVPPPEAYWVFQSDSNRLVFGSKYEITNVTKVNDMHEYSLTVLDVMHSDTGNYSLVVIAANLTWRRVFSLLVNVPPTVVLEPSGLVYANPAGPGTPPRQQQLTLTCQTYAMPMPALSWSYQPCVARGCADSGASTWEELATPQSPVEVYTKHNRPRVTTTSESESQVVINPVFSGRYRCSATNKLNTTTKEVQVIVRHGNSNLLLVEPRSPQLELAIGETLNFTCSANVWMLGSPNFFRKVPGSNQNMAIMNDQPCCLISRPRVPLFNISNIITLLFKATENGTMSIGCEAEVLDDAATVNSTNMVEVVVSHPMPPRLVLALPIGAVTAKTGTLVQFVCSADGFPRPAITWEKDGQPINFKPGGVIALSADGRNLTIERAHESDKGVYTCIAASIFGRVSSNVTLAIASDTIARLSDTNIAIVVVIVVLVLVSTVVGTVFIVRRFCRKKSIPHEFLLPTKDMLNPDIPLDEQTDCLPYDAEWEFPRESLKMGMLLGQGAFGRVLKADAFGIEPGVAVTTVAVKTVRDSDDIEQIKALISELKILIHLGQHLNIVNLLGAVTRRLKRGELLVIVEYCRYGNLRSYLLKHKAHFIDVLDAEGERSLAARQSSRRSVLPSVSGGGGDASDDYLNSSSRSQMHCEENPLTTLDVLYWSFQISRGMQYLASIQYIHRDLAARNVLLCDDGIVKICDFGLAKDIYKYHEYKKKTDGPLPIKWMALESLTHKLFTTASDVWSFGVTLWELFSMAATPYPGIELNEAFLEKLQAGYRMEQPKHAPDVIYKIMLKCWHPEASKRPTFADLSSELAELLSEPVRNHYFALEAPYTEKRDARQDYPPHYHKGLMSDSKDNDYLPVIAAVGTSSATTSSASPAVAVAAAAATDLDRAPTDYYNVGRSRPLDQSANEQEKAAAEEGTSDEKVPLSVAAASVYDDVNGHDVFEGEDIPMPTSVAPLPSPLDVERYAQMNQLAKDKRSGRGSPGLKLPTVAPSATGSSGAGKFKSEDKQSLLSTQHAGEQAAAAPPPPSAVHRPAAGARGAVKTSSTVETAI